MYANAPPGEPRRADPAPRESIPQGSGCLFPLVSFIIPLLVLPNAA